MSSASTRPDSLRAARWAGCSPASLLAALGRARVRIALLILASLLMLPGFAPAQDTDYSRYVSPWKTPWDYQGPQGAEHWSELDPDYAACNKGTQQSPIDIRNARKGDDLPAIRFEYISSPLKYVINNAHTIRVDYHDAPGTGNFLIVGDKRYQLTQFHFHRPSEERINGKQYEMVLHLMHTAADQEVAGVAILLKRGHENATIQQIWDHMPPIEAQEEVVGAELNPAGMLPHDTGYFLYTGSVTAPPCTEGVKWFVLKTPVEISAAQIQQFAKLYPKNVRPLQPLNGRVVQESR
jgi:carbonic anhydrase